MVQLLTALSGPANIIAWTAIQIMLMCRAKVVLDGSICIAGSISAMCRYTCSIDVYVNHRTGVYYFSFLTDIDIGYAVEMCVLTQLHMVVWLHLVGLIILDLEGKLR